MKARCTSCGRMWGISILHRLPKGGYLCPRCAAKRQMVPVLNLRQMSDGRWRELSRERALQQLEQEEIAPTEENLQAYFGRLRQQCQSVQAMPDGVHRVHKKAAHRVATSESGRPAKGLTKDTSSMREEERVCQDGKF